MAGPLPRRPFTLRAAIILWLVVSVLLAVAAGTFVASAAAQNLERAGLIGLGALFGGLATLQLLLLLPLRRGRRGARELLSTIGIIVGVPIIVRGTPGLSLIAGAMLVAVLLMWLPQSSDYFQLTHPKARKKFRLPGSR
ncbi:hypothetical protein D6T63_00925 [Arthrobacter cheniae]|uniref:Uncharacterized protein n=1 Tax=Arthrobacter cheniae TaxID=1258888 RepID=A0A3A5M8B2_9MICC|nr:hypothetical protein [Arthrobacter cheniae]RJT83055.1 hypothetical protein D6T63_00925 [Arthrobacter cheniae]